MNPFEAASYRKLWYKTTIRHIQQSYGPWIERGNRSWEDITQAREKKDDALYPCCLVCEEARGWLMKSRTFNPILSHSGQRKLTWRCWWQWGQNCRLKAPWPWVSAGGAGGVILNPQSRGGGRMSPSEIIPPQGCNCSTGQQAWPALTVWLCGHISKLLLLPWSPGTTVKRDNSHTGASSIPFWGGEQQSDHLAFLCVGQNWDRLLTSSPCGAEFCNCVCLWCQVLLGESYSDPVCFVTDITVLVNLCWGTACSCVRWNCCHCTQCIQFYLISAKSWLTPLRASAHHYWIILNPFFPFLTFSW